MVMFLKKNHHSGIFAWTNLDEPVTMAVLPAKFSGRGGSDVAAAVGRPFLCSPFVWASMSTINVQELEVGPISFSYCHILL